MIANLCVAIAVVSALMMTFSKDMRRVVLALWLLGISTGGLFLSFGAEMLALAQWVSATALTLVLVFHSLVFGEHREPEKVTALERLRALLIPALTGFSFMLFLWFAVRSAGSATVGADQASAPSLSALGTEMLGSYFLCVEILGLLLFGTLVGVGVICRPTTRKEEEGRC